MVWDPSVNVLAVTVLVDEGVTADRSGLSILKRNESFPALAFATQFQVGVLSVVRLGEGPVITGLPGAVRSTVIA